MLVEGMAMVPVDNLDEQSEIDFIAQFNYFSNSELPKGTIIQNYIEWTNDAGETWDLACNSVVGRQESDVRNYYSASDKLSTVTNG